MAKTPATAPCSSPSAISSKGFRLPEAALQLWAETDVFDEERRTHERRRSASAAFLSDFRDLKAGDLVVHVDHGIGVFVGLKRIEVGIDAQEFMELRYAADDKLFVPVERLDLVQKYTGASRPALDRLGGTTWEKAKTRVKKAMRDMAEELLKLYASRKAVPGHAFSPDSHWQQEFEDAFEWELTIDQQNAIIDIKRDMESPTPMDRLLCGDVGYGKTEVAMRAAFKAVMDGKQVALLAPTTVLAFQHLKTLRDRFAGVPGARSTWSAGSGPRPSRKQSLDDLAAGKVEIIVGTHRLLSKDVQFRDLGLLIVDEEQRFGVAHKERIKQLRKRVDVLTMTATPIPRTLNMSLAGIRDMSIIETPPKDRLSIQTNVVKFDQPVICARDSQRARARRPGLLRPQPRRVDHPLTGRYLQCKAGVGNGAARERRNPERASRQRSSLLSSLSRRSQPSRRRAQAPASSSRPRMAARRRPRRSPSPSGATPTTTSLLLAARSSGAAAWTLSGGAKVVSGNEPFNVSGAGSRSLYVPAGGTATSPTVCVGISEPSIRWFAKQQSLNLTGAMTVEVEFDIPRPGRLGTGRRRGNPEPELEPEPARHRRGQPAPAVPGLADAGSVPPPRADRQLDDRRLLRRSAHALVSVYRFTAV